MKIKKIILIIIAVIILILLIFFFIKPIFTGNVLATSSSIENNQIYTYTKAICNDSNFCQDYEIACNGEQVVYQSPITGAVIQHSEEWTDPRNDSYKLCE